MSKSKAVVRWSNIAGYTAFTDYANLYRTRKSATAAKQNENLRKHALWMTIIEPSNGIESGFNDGWNRAVDEWKLQREGDAAPTSQPVAVAQEQRP